MSEIEVSARIGAMIVKIAGARGADPVALASAAGFAPTEDPDARIPLALENALWEGAAAATGDPWFGLRAAAAIRPGMFDVLDYAVRTAPTAREAIARLARYNRLVHATAVFAIVDGGERVRIEHAFASGERPSRHASEFTLASLVVIGAQITGAPLVPLAVDLPHAAPDGDLTPYREAFGVVPRFAQAVGALELARIDVDRPCPAADPALSAIILRQANALLAALPDPERTTAARVRKHLAEHMPEGAPTLAEVAHALTLSERSLQRRLADEGTAFDALLDDVRRELALRYLAAPKTAIGEVAYLLGYSEPSAFHRAFKRWTGLTPAEARAKAA